MTINYILLVITGLYTVARIVNLVRGKGWLSRRILVDIAMPLVFILVLIATMMGMDYTTFVAMIEGRT